MAENMVERVARALLSAQGIPPDDKYEDANGNMRAYWQDATVEAREIIAAMRDVTPRMGSAGTAAIEQSKHICVTNRKITDADDLLIEASPRGAEETWCAMIDAALEDDETH